MRDITKEQLYGFFNLAGIPILNTWELVNQYWPRTYGTPEQPVPCWWLVKTPYGLIKMGWRKRVISIEWEDTGVPVIVTEDQVTKEPYLVHAWDIHKCLEYLATLGKHLKNEKQAPPDDPYY